MKLPWKQPLRQATWKRLRRMLRQTTWKRCYLGLPALVTAIAENQFAVAADCGAAGLIRYLGTWTDVTEARLIEELRACARPEVLRELQRRCQLDVQADGDDSETFEEVLFT